MARRGPAGTVPLDDERLTRVAQNVPMGFFEVDSTGALTFVSPQWCELTGMDADAALGRGWFDTIHFEDRLRIERAFDDAIAHGVSLDEVYRIKRTDEILTVRTCVTPVGESAEMPNLFAGVTADVTDFEQLRVAAEIMPQFIWIAAPDGTILYFNRPWLEYTGVTVEAMRRDGVKNVVHPDELGLTWEQWNSALVTGNPYEIEYRLRNAATGTYRWFLARAVPYRNAGGDIVRWIGTATDIDAQKRASDNLRFVIDASAALSANLDVDAVCATMARIAIERVADWCFIALKDPGGGYETRAIAHRDADRVAELERLRDRYPVQNGSALDRAVRGNAPILIPSITSRELAAAATNEEHLRILESLRIYSAMLIPLATDDGIVYGGITLASAESGRTYTARDLEVAEMVAHRAAAAIHTATAFEQERQRSQRLRFIAEASELLVEGTELQTMLDRLVDYIVSEMADLAYVILVEDRETLRTVACAHADPRKALIAERLRGRRTLRPDAEETAIWMLSQHRTVLHKHVAVDAVLSSMWEYLAPEVRALDIRSAITVPLFSRGETIGALVVYKCSSDRAYTDQDAEVFTDVGRRLSIAIDHLQTMERERRIAAALQQALLPQPGMLPIAPGLRFAAHYRPSTYGLDVGGDWYDAVTLPDGSIIVSVGDVSGRGLHAAGLMGKLRQAIGMAALYERDPARILDAVDFQLRARRSTSLATAFIGIIDASGRVMRYAGAGHPPPLLRRDGDILELRSTGLPLGLRDYDHQNSSEVELAGADLLVMYTDGLTEATRDLLFGEQRLAFLVGSEAISFVRNPAEFLCDACLPPDAQDDTAVLTVTFGEAASWSFDAENAEAAHEARSELAGYLRERADAQADIAAAELVFGELVGNVVRHAPGPIEVQVEWSGPQPVLHVIDRGRGFLRDPSLPADPLSENGRGLYIVSQLTDALRIERIAGYGNHVAAVLRL
jgi:PAS domain S-box-containing protein